jgi:hypothetical protein
MCVPYGKKNILRIITAHSHALTLKLIITVHLLHTYRYFIPSGKKNITRHPLHVRTLCAHCLRTDQQIEPEMFVKQSANLA